MKCPKCQFENPDDTIYCGKCATPLKSSEEIPVSQTKTLETPTEELTTGSTFAGRYQIIEELGKGGMGKVYKALDTEIKEKVALKLIKPEIASEQKTLERFRNELKLARKIVHKNVGRMYELMEEKGIHFITMEYVPGEDLKSFIKRSGQLAIGTTIRIAKQVCEGLAESHSLGVVHRDLKPSNIMIDKEGNARIMDFGIARSPEAKGITGAGVMIGTPEYMSPEQVEGKETDQRSDIYSLGIILYLSIAMKHKSEIPKDPKEFNTQIPEDLRSLILKCMEKNKEKRYQGADAILSEFETIGKIPTTTISVSEWQNSIAVLPFADLSPKKDQEYFCDGIAEELINVLTKIKDLRVVARTSAFSFKNKQIDIREIGKKLNVQTLLEGSVRKAGDRIRITAQLINVEDGYHIWSERYDRELEDVFAIQDEISLAIVDNLKIELLREEKAAVLKRSTNNLEAYNLYLKGIYYLRTYPGKKGFNEANGYFQQALQKDPNYTMAYYGLSEAYINISYWGNVPPKVAFPKAKAYAKKALEIDETNGEAHGALGFIHTIHDWNWKAAERELRQAIELCPNSAMTHMYYSFFLTNTERHKEAIIEAQCGRELDPVSSFINAFAGLAIFYDEQYERAIEELKMTLTMHPNHFIARYHLAQAYQAKSMIKESIAEYEKAVELSGGVPFVVVLLAMAYYTSGEKAQAEKLFDSLEQRSRNEYVPPTCFFFAHLTRGNLNQAYKWLKIAGEEHDGYLCWIRVMPRGSYHVPDEPRIKTLLKRKGIKMMIGKTMARYRILEKNS
jgi:serine/threonine protein kinase/tetratricopeptide (TPR) repeat protein